MISESNQIINLIEQINTKRTEGSITASEMELVAGLIPDILELTHEGLFSVKPPMIYSDENNPSEEVTEPIQAVEQHSPTVLHESVPQVVNKPSPVEMSDFPPPNRSLDGRILTTTLREQSLLHAIRSGMNSADFLHDIYSKFPYEAREAQMLRDATHLQELLSVYGFTVAWKRDGSGFTFKELKRNHIPLTDNQPKVPVLGARIAAEITAKEKESDLEIIPATDEAEMRLKGRTLPPFEAIAFKSIVNNFPDTAVPAYEWLASINHGLKSFGQPPIHADQLGKIAHHLGQLTGIVIEFETREGKVFCSRKKIQSEELFDII